MVKTLGWVTDRWLSELEPVLRTATVEQEREVRALWERELAWWKNERHLQGDSLRNPLTYLRSLIGQLEVTPENSWEDVRTGKREHIGLRICNLQEGEWFSLNDRSRAATQERNNHQQLVRDPDTIVGRALGLLLSDDWAELVVALAVCTGRRVVELLKTGEFTVHTPYTVWFEGQVKGRTRVAGRFELPTPVRSYLVTDAVKKLRRLVDCTEMELHEVTRRYDPAVNDAVERLYGPLIPGRSDRERLTVHNLRPYYCSLVVLWYAPDTVSDVNYKAYIQGHRAILDPQVQAGATPQEVEQVQLDYGSHANYDDYKIADDEGRLDGRHGIKLGLPGVTVLEYFQQHALPAAEVQQVFKSKGTRSRAKPLTENKTGRSLLRPSVETKSWFDDVRLELQRQLHREVNNDEFLRRLLVAYLAGGALQRAGEPFFLSLDDLDLPAPTRAVLQQALVLSETSDLLSFLLSVGEREARSLVREAVRHDTTRYASLPTSKLATFKLAEASQERIRRAVYTIMHWNSSHGPLEQWYLTTLAIQNLVGGRKDAINAYLRANQEEIDAHHQELQIQPSYNRKPVSINQMLTVAEEPGAYPWGQHPDVEPDEEQGAHDGEKAESER